MSDTATPTVEPEVERVRDVGRGFNLLAGSGPGLLADAMKSGDPGEASAVSPVATGEG